MKEANKQLHNSFAKLRSFPGATLKYLRYYFVSSLVDETLDNIILHRGCNDVNNKNSTPEKTANKIGDMAILCIVTSLGGSSLMICRSSKFLRL